MSGEDKRAQRACRIRRDGRGRVRTAGIRGDRRAVEPAGRDTRLPDGQRHAQPRNRRDREHPPRAGAALRRHLRRDAAAHAARGGHRRQPNRPAPPMPTSSSPSAAARSPTAPRRCSSASPTISATPTTSTGSGPVAALRRSSTAPTVRQISVPTTIAGGEFSATAGVTNEKTKVKEALRHPLLMPRAVILDPWLGRAHAGMAVALDRHPRRRSLRRGHLLARGAPLRRRPGAEGACRCWRRRCRG